VEGGHRYETHSRATRAVARLEAPLEPDRRQRGGATWLADFLRIDSADLSGPVEDGAALSECGDCRTVDGDSGGAAAPSAAEGGQSENAAAAAQTGSGRAGETGSQEAAHFRDSEGRGAEAAKSGSPGAGDAGASRGGEDRYDEQRTEAPERRSEAEQYEFGKRCRGNREGTHR